MSKEDNSPVEKLFGSKTRTKLLDLFFGNPTESYYVREITRVVEEQINSVRRELLNLENLGIIKNESYEGKNYYSANEKHPFCRPLSEMFSKKNDTVVREVKVRRAGWEEHVKPVRNYLRALLVTNRAPGEEGLDMLIIGDNKDKKLSNWALAMEKKKGRPLDFMIMDAGDLAYRKSVRDRTLMAIFEMEVAAIIDPDKIIRS